MRSLHLLAFLPCLSVLTCAASEPEAVTNTVDVTAGGVLAEPVQLHRQVFADWLADPDYNSWTNYTDGTVSYERPQITKLVWDTPDNAIYMRNLCPGTTYEWAVTNNGAVVKSGSFTTAANPPRWLISGSTGHRYVSNLRDLGGWEIPGGNGRRTKFGVFFRSAALDFYFFDHDRRSQNNLHSELGINTELDLRGGENIVTVKTDPDADIEGESYYFENPNASIADIIGIGPENSFTTAPSVDDGSIRYFRVEMIYQMTRAGSSAAEEIRKAFHVLGTKAYHPVLFHCAGGRDRTGFIAFLLEGLCGLREEQLYRDHLSIVFAKQGAMYSVRLDGNIRDLYTMRESDGSFSFGAYGDSLAGHIRAFLESIGVTAAEIATITEAYTGETPDQLLDRVNAFEAAQNYRTVWFVSPDTRQTNAVHRIGNGDLLHPPLLCLEDHIKKYNLERKGYVFTGWSEEKAVAGSTDTYFEAQWRSANPGPGPGVSAWTYDEPSMTVCDGKWMLGVSVADGALTLLDLYAAPETPDVLDFTKPVLTTDGQPSGLVFTGIGDTDHKSCLFERRTEFRGRITGVRFPDDLTRIGGFAFNKCTGLAGSVVLPNGLTMVPTNAFAETGITEVVLPESCTKICFEAFNKCTRLTNVVVGAGLKTVEYKAFNEDTRLVSFTPGFPSSVECLGEYAFYGVKYGGDLRLPHIGEIPYKCLNGMPLTSLYVPSVTNVGREVVASAVLTNVTFGVRPVTFINFHDGDNRVGYKSFSSAANPCCFLFPDKAPVLPKTGDSAAGGYTGTSGSMFGTKAGGAILCGSWSKDRAGWQRIIDEIGAPVSDVAYTLPTLPDADWSVKGVLRYTTGSTTPTYAWLVDCGSSGDGDPAAAVPVSVRFSGDRFRVELAEVLPDCWYAIEKTTDLSEPFVLDTSTVVTGSDIISGRAFLEIPIDAKDPKAFYRIISGD